MQKGFLSMEVLAAAAMLAALASICAMYAAGGKMIAASANLTTAVFLAEKQMACVKGLLAAQADLTGSVGWQDTEDALPLTKNGTDFTVRTTVEDACGGGLRRIQVAVGWQEYAAKRSVRLESLFVADE